MHNNLLWTLIIILILFSTTLLFAGNYFYNLSILRRKKEFLSHDPDLKETNSGEYWDSKKEWLEQQTKEEWNIESYDGLSLYALYVPCPIPSDHTVILVHGYSSWHGSMGGFAQYYSEELGYNVLMPDLRGHGNSEGNYIGFGWHDRKDMLQWINLVLQKSSGETKIVLHGVSMGGATVLMTSGEVLPNNIKCITSDCAYSSIEGILGYQMKRMYGLPKFPLLHITSMISRIRAGYSFKEASAVRQVRNAHVPILFIHGSADKFVPTKMAYELYDAASGPKQLLIIEEAAHGTSFWKDTQVYKAALHGFLSKYV